MIEASVRTSGRSRVDRVRRAGAGRCRFIGVSIAEGLALGAALGILVLGRGWFASLVPHPGLATGAWLSSVYLLGSWWPHTAMHRHFGNDLGNLLWIEWVFHVGAMLAIGVLLGALVWTTTRGRAANPAG